MNEAEAAINSNLHGLMGMAEMEWALAVIIRHTRECPTPCFQRTEIDPRWFTDDRDLDGFVQLCCRGMIDTSYPNGSFFPSYELATRVVARFPELGPAENRQPIEYVIEALDAYSKPGMVQ